MENVKHQEVEVGPENVCSFLSSQWMEEKKYVHGNC